MSDNFNEKRKEFIEQIKPLLEKYFYKAEDKSSFVERWKEVVKSSEFCKLKFSYKPCEYEEDDDEEYHQDFQITQNYDYVDCTRKSNPDCMSGDLCFPFGAGANGTQLAYIHTNSKNMIITHDDDIYLSDNIDEEVFEKINHSGISFLYFINILKPEVTNTVLMLEGNYSKFLQIEKDNLLVRYSSNITPADEWDYGDELFETREKADEFYFSFIEKYAKNNALDLTACSDDVRSKVELLVESTKKQS